MNETNETLEDEDLNKQLQKLGEGLHTRFGQFDVMIGTTSRNIDPFEPLPSQVTSSPT